MRLRVLSLALLSGLSIWCCRGYGVGRRHGSDPALLWLWRRLAATAPIRPLAWELPYAVGAAQEMAKRPKTNKKNKNIGVPVVVQWLTNPTRNHEVAGSVPALAQWVNDPALQ